MRSPHYRAFRIMLLSSTAFSTRRLNDVLGYVVDRDRLKRKR